MMGAKSQADESSGPAEPSHPHQKAEDMTAPETFTEPSKQPLTTGRRPDRTGVWAKAGIPVRARSLGEGRFLLGKSPKAHVVTVERPPTPLSLRDCRTDA